MGVVCSATMSATSGAERIVECTLESDYSLGVLRLAITAGGTHLHPGAMVTFTCISDIDLRYAYGISKGCFGSPNAIYFHS